MNSPRAITAASTLGEWLDHPVGGELIRGVLAPDGGDLAQLEAGRGLPLEVLVTFGAGELTQDAINDLVVAVNGDPVGIETSHKDSASDDGLAFRADWTLAEIRMRDPFIVHDPATSMYWLYGTTDKNVWFGAAVGFDAYCSTDLTSWEGPFEAFRPPVGFWSESNYWAPEVHSYQGRWFMFATFTAPDGHRGTQILVSDVPQGPFSLWSAGTVTPRRWQNLDGTLFLDLADGPWIVYAHEWGQVHDGIIWAQRLSTDLREPLGVPVYLFSASEAPWARPIPRPATESDKLPSYVTDGPFLFRLTSGHLIMLWSSFGEHGYAMGIAHSTSGDITGPWTHEEEPLWSADGGHGMIARLHDGTLALTFHQPNNTPNERPVIRRLIEHETTVIIDESTNDNRKWTSK
ncbi:glycoside hydrolase family 43 protein [Paenarthrobacter nicotinovorans]|uniref:glycoside hydrolase family 43 protein n=1 Tax=Paenarthrobacter nicotinovorans TaxID=29320 RepID=UPI0037494F9C